MMHITSDCFKWSSDESGEWLSIRTSGARKICESIEPGKQYDVEVKEHREKRSLDMNAYCWLLIGKLAAKLNLSPDEVYRSYIKDVAGNYQIVPIKAELVEKWDHLWCSGHIGRITVDIGPCRAENLKGYHNVISYFGSSDYDTKQMSRLISLVVEDAKAQGIETLTPQELSRMEEEWDAKN